ncbi:bifunctional acetaldehyde-CoA/alcohol dehydrogenase [Loigolactobacillus coryniformis]|jgi:acetaldehyde dehydrogenase/alcohol dehydrogenase|uniref:Aldehyde-alcohol dehydrogenase n=1 Tax=Loigolactobacillus coryniformis subsp. coryniformis CECT 5711 TaxID=1185325 RepID=J3JAV8_9LACO|nr:bifunctional acetaldehyde-CoA/alcohol dehydrogenase [Loigolactobacillus coryniformis]MDT3390923.1 bifunctional acetaldehyde-CoA/alcohol dehydrogenase [Bacillota bacterium]EJN55192.1 bifunctional protein alcohol dehydrogenase/acetaldehyde dehydrogenase [Loigolactobacillus coryniformis subsp. coryniformis CECT 5711]MBW4802945.1 bifunctional acetaldehyde-CoA/alcohol dehydrogenase [Loigolactobacillus coryniformis subsp. torquens]MBW4805641.1 bifunctional acetaldehyde-CoA/alcohol dehydrogenase [L
MLKQTKTENKTEDKSVSVEKTIDGLVKKSQAALATMSTFTQEKVDAICEAMALAALDHHMELAKMAVEETHRGIVEDKAIKNIYASEYVWNSIRHDKTVGVIDDDDEEQIIKIAEPLGVVAGVTPVTNPTSTVVFKSLISLKGRNTIIFGFHPQAQQACVRTAQILLDAAIEAGAPADCIQWIADPSIEATGALMHHEDIATILATGGPGMVKAAYSSGNPALGVGPGNGPAYIEKTADIKQAVNDIVLSKTFDNGMVCASENSAIVDQDIYAEVKAEFKYWNCYFVKKSELKALGEAMFDEKRGGVKGPIAGKSAYQIAQLAGIDVPKDTKVLIAEIDGVGPKYPLSREKLSPVLSLYKVKDHEAAFARAKELLEFGGLGHTASIHTRDDELVKQFGMDMLACRILVNSPSALGGIGNIYNNMTPSLTLGTGSYGKNSISHNVSDMDLINIKTVAKRRNNMQWVKLPPKVYFERNSVRYLEHMEGIKRVFLVCDPGMVEFGYSDRVLDVLRKRTNQVEIDIFSDVEPNPSTDTVYKGVARMDAFKPDTIIALGGGSAMDAAKFMWLMYEHPETSFFGAKQKFLDIRKRTYRVPVPNKAKYIGIPTTSGTGSEVTPYAVITDSKTHVKYPITDYAMQPDIAIVDSQFVETVPKRTTAWTGLDAITHATEAYVSVMSSEYTRGWALQALKLAFNNLKASYDGNREARQKMHDAATMAGMAFASAYLGINHSIAHKLGGEFDLPHGLAIAITYPQVVRYNATVPTKIAMWPKYSHFTALQDYADIARYLGLKGNTDEELKEALVQAFIDLAHSVDVTLNLKDNRVDKAHFDRSVDKLAELAFEDQCTPANPKEPLISELKEILIREWDGQGVETK